MQKLQLFAACLLVNLSTAQQISSTFDTGIDNWLVVGDATSAEPNYVTTGGNPGGYASADDTAAGGVWVWSAPAKFLGNQATSYGKMLRFDLKQSSLNSQFDDSDVIISGTDITIALDLPNNPGTDWTHYDVLLNETLEWKIDNINSGVLASATEITAVLADITSLKIRGEYVSGSDTGGLDNVILETDALDAKSFSDLKWNFYPNPVKDHIHFSTEISDVEFYDIHGKKIDLKMQDQTVDMSQLPVGIYTVMMASEGKSQIQKIVKK